MIRSGRRRGLVERAGRTARLLPALIRREIRTRYRSSVLDLAWALLVPVSLLLVYGLVLTQSFGVEGACSPYLSTAWIGLVVWTFFATSVGHGVTTLLSSGDLITKVYFPREALPLSVVGASLLDLGIGMLSVAILLPIQGLSPSWVALWAVLPLLLVIAWSALIAVLVSVLAVFFRDVVHGVNLVLRVGFFATPVVYETNFLPEAFRFTARYNPVTVAIDGLRDCLLCGQRPELRLLGTHLLVGAAAFVAAIVYVRAVESRVVDAS